MQKCVNILSSSTNKVVEHQYLPKYNLIHEFEFCNHIPLSRVELFLRLVPSTYYYYSRYSTYCRYR